MQKDAECGLCDEAGGVEQHTGLALFLIMYIVSAFVTSGATPRFASCSTSCTTQFQDESYTRTLAARYAGVMPPTKTSPSSARSVSTTFSTP